MRFDLVVNTFVKDALTRGELLLHGGGWMSRPLVEVQDAVSAIVACVEAPDEVVAGQIFNVVQDNYTVRDLAHTVAGAVSARGREVNIVEAPAPAMVRNYSCSSEKLCSALGLKLTRDVPSSVQELLAAYGDSDPAQLAKPAYYNLQWMVLLREVHSLLRPFDYVLRRDEAPFSE
jgi:nucleoside-diphosphate-sugar epimerase